MRTLKERFSIHGRKALVTGASRGLGQTICAVLSEAGADIIAIGRDEGALRETKALVEANHRQCMTMSVDIGDADAPESIAKHVLQDFGRLDILVNNAGISHPKSLLAQTVDEWDATFGVNLRAAWLMARAFAPLMMQRGGGKIVNVSSQTSTVALPDHGAYMASKAALNALTKAMTVEWAKHNIQANAVCPTIVWTPMGERVWSEGNKLETFLKKMPSGRVARPEEVADLVLFLSSQASDMINGQEIFVDGGYTAI